MIYGNIILENQFNNLTNPMTIMQNYYENEISFLNSVIEYQNEATVSESTELETIYEGFIGNIIDKIKELINRFINWIKSLWDKFMSLFKRKTKSADSDIKQVKDKVKKIENDNTLSKEEKEVKKQKIVDKIVKSNSEDSAKSTDSDVKLIEYKPKRYRYYGIESFYIFNTLLLKANAATADYIEDLDEDNIKMLRLINNKLDNVKSVTSLDEAWEEFTKKYYYSPRVMTADQVLKHTEENIEEYKKVQESFEKGKKNIDKRTDSLRKSINKINKDTNNENLSLYYSILNKYIAINEKEIAIAAQFIIKLGSNLKVIESND